MPASPVLGLETSCDETAAAVLDADGRVLAERVASQDGHAAFGGVVPEIAARSHLAVLPDMVASVLHEAGVPARSLAAVAATIGPGLIGGLIVGHGLGHGLALAAGIPFLPINHLEAHALSIRLPSLGHHAPFPYLLLLVSGGHTQFVAVHGVGRARTLGGTIDDAVGEAFDKVAKLLGLGWPGGAALERLAATGDPTGIPLPRPLLGRPGCDVSLSGLKTAVAARVAGYPPGEALPRDLAADLAAGFQAAVADTLADRASHALARMPEASLLVVAGGVAANAAIRAALATAVASRGARLLAPPPRLCTDNAVMVAWAGIERLRAGVPPDPSLAPRPRWPLDAPTRA